MRKVLTIRLIAVFVGVVGLGILAVGFLFKLGVGLHFFVAIVNRTPALRIAQEDAGQTRAQFIGHLVQPPCGEIAMCARVGRMGPIK